MIANKMASRAVPLTFAIALIDLVASDHRSIYEIMALWDEAVTDEDRNEAIADLQELLDDMERKGPKRELQYLNFEDLKPYGQKMIEYKNRLRAIIDNHGGVSKVAELSGIPQPSLSRMLNSAAAPRQTTIHKIARALQLPEAELAADLER